MAFLRMDLRTLRRHSKDENKSVKGQLMLHSVPVPVVAPTPEPKITTDIDAGPSLRNLEEALALTLKGGEGDPTQPEWQHTSADLSKRAGSTFRQHQHRQNSRSEGALLLLSPLLSSPQSHLRTSPNAKSRRREERKLGVSVVTTPALTTASSRTTVQTQTSATTSTSSLVSRLVPAFSTSLLKNQTAKTMPHYAARGHTLSEPALLSDDESDAGSIQASPVVQKDDPGFDTFYQTDRGHGVSGFSSATTMHTASAPSSAAGSGLTEDSSLSSADRDIFLPNRGYQSSYSHENDPDEVAAYGQSSQNLTADEANSNFYSNVSHSQQMSLPSKSNELEDPYEPMAGDAYPEGAPVSSQMHPSRAKYLSMPMPSAAGISHTFVPSGPPIGTESHFASSEMPRPRPVSTVINRATFQYERATTGNEDISRGNRHSRDPSGAALDEEEDDVLPFEATRLMATRGREQRSLLLPELSSGLVMSKDKFDTYRKSLANLDLARGGSIARKDSRTARSDDEDSDIDDEEDKRAAKERRMRIARARQQRDVQLAVYRQKMTKMIGGEPVTLNTTTMDASGQQDGEADDDDDNDLLDDIPLSVLRAHNFPKRATNKKVDTSSGSAAASAIAKTGSSSALAAQRLPASPSTGVVTMLAGDPPRVGTPSLRASPSMGTLSPQARAQQARWAQSPPPALPNVFGPQAETLRRGLVGEIAKEEEARMRRNAGFQPFDRERSRLSIASGLSMAGGQRLGVDGVADSSVLAEMQQQLQQLSEMQNHIISQMNGGGVATPTPSMMMRSYPPSLAPKPSSASLRSEWAPRNPMRMSEPIPSFHPPPSPRPSFGHDRRDSMPGRMAPSPSLMSGRLPPSPLGQMRPMTSRMRLVDTPDDEVDEDKEWEKLVEKRQAIRAQWHAAASASAT